METINRKKQQRRLLSAWSLIIALLTLPVFAQTDYKLVWSDEFNVDGSPDTTNWSYENGFVRNQEWQWYQASNAEVRDGVLVITARNEIKPNPKFKENSTEWKELRKQIECTSSSLITKKKREFLYGRFEVRARIPASRGSWPAIWLKGSKYEWPSCGEVDMMEFYQIKNQPHILANVCWGSEKQYVGTWNTKTRPYADFVEKEPYWASQFHVWRMDWDENFIRLYLDDELLNETPLSRTVNGKRGGNANPFHTPMFLLVNLAMGGGAGGKVDAASLPVRYEIDYVRVYQK